MARYSMARRSIRSLRYRRVFAFGVSAFAVTMRSVLRESPLFPLVREALPDDVALLSRPLTLMPDVWLMRVPVEAALATVNLIGFFPISLLSANAGLALAEPGLALVCCRIADLRAPGSSEKR